VAGGPKSIPVYRQMAMSPPPGRAARAGCFDENGLRRAGFNELERLAIFFSKEGGRALTRSGGGKVEPADFRGKCEAETAGFGCKPASGENGKETKLDFNVSDPKAHILATIPRKKGRGTWKKLAGPGAMNWGFDVALYWRYYGLFREGKSAAGVLLNEWNIQSRARMLVKACGRSFADKEHYHTLLFDREGGISGGSDCLRSPAGRKDYSEGSREERKGFLSYWQGNL